MTDRIPYDPLAMCLAAAGTVLLLAAMPARAVDALTEDFDDTRLDKVAEVIDLDQETRDQIEEISRGVAEENAPRRSAIRKERLLLRALLEDSPPDEAAVMSQVDELSSLQSALWKTRLRAMMQMRALLTPLQREQLVQLQQRESSEAAGACRTDVRSLCPNAIDMRTSISCLIERRDEISDGCRERLSQGRLSRFFQAD